MTFARYLLGVVLAGIALVPVCGCSWALRARMLPRWAGPPARLVEVVLGLGVVVGVSEVLGAVGLFRTAPMVVGLAGVGAILWHMARRGSSDREASAVAVSQTSGSAPPADAAMRGTTDERLLAERGPGAQDPEAPNRLGRGALIVALVATAVLVAEWSTRTVAALNHGIGGVSVDSLWYHLPTAARFVQEGSITGLHYVDPGAVVVFYPATSPLLHGIGILLLGNDLLSPLLNLGVLALALLGGWCVGRPFGVAPVTLTGTALLLATPGFAATQPGGGYNDVVGLALFLASVAVLVNSDLRTKQPELAVIGVAALAAGLALGTKFTFIVPVAALSVGVIAIAPRSQRLRWGGVWSVVVALAGGFWYFRNLLAVGNPLPGFSFGPLNLPSPPNQTPTSTVSEFLLDGDAWERYFFPGLGKAYGPAWWVLLVLVTAGLVLAVLTGPRRLERMLGFVGLASAVAYVFSPQILTLGDEPYYFVYNLRYAAPALLLGLVLLPISPAFTAGRRASWVLGAFALVLGAVQLDPSVWPTNIFGLRFVEPVRGIDSLGGALVGAAVLVIGALLLSERIRARLWHPPMPAVAAAVVVAVAAAAAAAAGFGLQRVYLRDRYQASGPPLAPWARDIENERIAIVGPYAILQYPLYGKDLSNHVQYVGKRGPHGAFDPIRECAAWRRTLNAGDYSYVITLRETEGASPESAWTSSDSAAEFVTNDGWNRPTRTERQFPELSLFRINEPLDPQGCSQLPAAKRTVPVTQQPSGGT